MLVPPKDLGNSLATDSAAAECSPTPAVSDSHCGAGCLIGDIIAEFSLFALGWTLLGMPLYAEETRCPPRSFGVVFQYFANLRSLRSQHRAAPRGHEGDTQNNSVLSTMVFDRRLRMLGSTMGATRANKAKMF